MVGGDIDIALTIDVSFRPGEIDYLLTAFGDNTSLSGTSIRTASTLPPASVTLRKEEHGQEWPCHNEQVISSTSLK
jgi:hypothetical protein